MFFDFFVVNAARPSVNGFGVGKVLAFFSIINAVNHDEWVGGRRGIDILDD